MNISKRYLRQPRDKGWTFKMETPKELVGVENSWSGVSFQKTIHIGLNTQDLRDAAQQQDLILAEITRLRRQVSDEERLSDARAIRWGEHFRVGLVEPVVRNVELANGEEVKEEIVIEHEGTSKNCPGPGAAA